MLMRCDLDAFSPCILSVLSIAVTSAPPRAVNIASFAVYALYFRAGSMARKIKLAEIVTVSNSTLARTADALAHGVNARLNRGEEEKGRRKGERGKGVEARMGWY